MKTKRLINFIEYLMVLNTIRILKLFPYQMSQKFLTYIFVFWGLCLGIRKSIVLKQLSDCYPEKSTKELKIILKKMHISLSIVAGDMFLRDDLGNKKISVAGWENIEDSLSLGRGVLIVGGHLGNWELAGRYISKNNIPISVVIKRIRNIYINKLVNSIRVNHGIKIIYKKRALRPILKAFSQNEAVVTLIDQNAGREGVRVPFLTKDASLFTGFTRLAIRNNTPLVLGISVINEDGSYKFIFEKPIIPDEYRAQGSYKDNYSLEIDIAKHFHKRLEYYISCYPEQWFWLHKRWKGANKAKTLS